ncbi:MAG: c(7)-type cytochrome triheme domain-containing protein [Thermodesulfobacteriota bacterium]
MKRAGRISSQGGGGGANPHQWSRLVLLVMMLLAASRQADAKNYWNLPPLPPAHEYGDILIDRLSATNGVKAVFFSHWSHRSKYTCRVCHWELGFAFKAGGTDMTESDNRNGLFCGKCHDGKVAFGHSQGHCQRCHTGTRASSFEKFIELQDNLPRDRFGNEINWAEAIDTEQIRPLYSIFKPQEKPLGFRKELVLEAEWLYVPPAYFPHEVHAKWLDCGSCHPDIFNIKKKATEHFRMKYILEEKFCGVCHLRVAFPMNNCKRCHPALKRE